MVFTSVRREEVAKRGRPPHPVRGNGPVRVAGARKRACAVWGRRPDTRLGYSKAPAVDVARRPAGASDGWGGGRPAEWRWECAARLNQYGASQLHHRPQRRGGGTRKKKSSHRHTHTEKENERKTGASRVKTGGWCHQRGTPRPSVPLARSGGRGLTAEAVSTLGCARPARRRRQLHPRSVALHPHTRRSPPRAPPTLARTSCLNKPPAGGGGDRFGEAHEARAGAQMAMSE